MAESPMVEQVVTMPVFNPETGRRTRKFKFAGKVDLVRAGTVSDYKGVADTQRFIHRAGISFQAELYGKAIRHAKHPVTEIEYRLVTRPGLKYTLPTYKWAVMKEGRKSAVKVCDTKDEAEKDASERRDGYDDAYSVDERITGYPTRQAYEDRCLEWLQEDPVRLVSHSVPLSGGALMQAGQYLWHCAQRILHNRKTGYWMPNGSACFGYNRACPFLEVCQCVKADADHQWILDDQFHLGNPHPELGEAGKDFGLITHSSMEVLTSCELKYLFMFELGYRPGQEDSEPLWVGSAMHAGLEHYNRRGLVTGLQAVDDWAETNPVLGEDATWHQDQQIGRARAMVRAAATKWPVEKGPG